MLAACFLIIVFLFYNAVRGEICHFETPHHQNDDQNLTLCITGILDEYFSDHKGLTYVDMSPGDDKLLREIHSTKHFTFISRRPIQQMNVPNRGYLVFSPDVSTFSVYLDGLRREPFWNPYARFLIIIELLQNVDLRQVFDALLQLHVNDALVVNATKHAHLYTYNPFDNNACGRYYNDVISYGLCSQKTHNLYPNKFVTGLRNCTFRASLTSRPPYTIDPTQNEYRNKLPGLEQYVLKTVSKTDEFNINFEFDFESAPYTEIAPNMTAIGPMDILQKNKTDVLCGALILTASRIGAFSAVFGYNDYVDDMIFAVKKASYVPNWKYFYLEFNASVWVLLLVCLLVYSAFVIFLLQPKDKGEVVLELLGYLVTQGRNIPLPLKVKCVLIMWVWFAFLVNIFYQSSLVSLMANPSREYQISNEDDMAEHNLKPCIPVDLAKLLYAETNKIQYHQNSTVKNVACESIPESLDLISKNSDMFSVVVTFYYKYNSYTDKYGDPMFHYLEKPFSKLLRAYYFYKGFPISNRFQLNMMRMRENGLSDKNLQDQYYMRRLKNRVYAKEFEYRFVAPWGVYAVGCLIASTSFFVELMTHFGNRRAL